MLLNIMGVPIQNIVLANEFSATEEVVTEETKINESATAETNINNSEDMRSEAVPPSEKEAESTEKSFSETVPEESKGLTDMPEVDSSEITETSSETQQSEERPSTKAVTSGTFPNGSTATWNFDDTTGTLTISGGTLVNPANSIQDLTGIDVSEITNIVLEDKVFASGNCHHLFYSSAATSLDLSNFDTSNVTDMSNMFANSAATSIDVSNFDTSNVTNMQNMFWTSAVTSLDLSNWDTINVTNMMGVFFRSAATSLDLSSFDTSNVTTMRNMFYENAATSLDLRSFDTSNVTDMYGMFRNSAATNIDVSNFDISNVTTMYGMFSRSVVISLDLRSFDTSNMPDMANMFDGASQLQNLILGNQFQFLNANEYLSNPTPTAKYTGKWQNVGNGTVDKPKGTFIGTANELMSTYDGSTMADTYVWQPVLLEVNVQDSVLMVGDIWNPEDNFLSALDNAENPVDFKDITVTGSVDTTQPGLYTVTYSYGGITSTATITVLETAPVPQIRFFVDGQCIIQVILGLGPNTPEWDLTTGLWDKWNPGTIKVPTDKLPSEPTKQGYEFKGWKDTAGTIVDFNKLDLDLNSQNEFDFDAAFEKKEYTVTFDVEGKQEQEAVLFDELITEPTVPNKAEYAFTGWYDAPTGGNKWDFSTDKMPAGNVTLYAQFNKLGFVTPEIKPSVPTAVTPIMPGVDPTTSSVTSSKGGKLAKLGENSSLLLQGFGLLLVLSGTIFFLFKRKNTRY
ncbi:BspA family leucine-rich repeat surface protein [Listeria innocua]|nr:BspA family leucine-rich repeat surface protein [Listeria innocua]